MEVAEYIDWNKPGMKSKRFVIEPLDRALGFHPSLPLFLLPQEKEPWTTT